MVFSGENDSSAAERVGEGRATSRVSPNRIAFFLMTKLTQEEFL
jgi:hypothetical protein